MEIRRTSREQALQALFFADISCYNEKEIISLFYKNFSNNKGIKDFFNRIIKGVLENKSNIDKIIEIHSNNWKVHRMSCVDRNILRIAIFEIMYCDDIPPKVSMNEAIDIGKRFGTEESGAFINGILNSIHVSKL